MSGVSFNPITYDGLSFTNITLNETDIGSVIPLATAGTQPIGVVTGTGGGITWGGYQAGAYYANSSEVLNFNYSVSTTSPTSLIDSASQLYVLNALSGPGVSLTAIENIYSTGGTLLATETFIGGQTPPPAVTFSQAAQAINVSISVTMSVSSAGNTSSFVLASQFEQSYGTVAAPPATASIGDIVFFDATGSGLKSGFDSGPGVAGVTVDLLNGPGTSVLAVTTTNSSGLYNFSNLQAGVYEVKFVAPTGMNFTTEGVGINAAINSSANQTTGITAPITLTAGQADHNVEAGLVSTSSAGGGSASLGNTVWLDTNANGLDDNNEAGVAGVTVELLNASGTSVIALTTTNASGNYQFTDLAPATYEVQFLAPTGDGFTTQNVPTTPTAPIDSVVNNTGLTGPIVLTAGEVDNNVNAGLTLQTGSLSNVVWFDTNHDGLLDNNEAGVPGVTVDLLNSAGSVVAVTTTNASGTYTFNGITPGSYEVKAILPSGDVFTTQGATGGTNSVVNTTTGISPTFTVGALQSVGNENIGLYAPASIGTTVWFDANANGLDDNSEAGVAGVTVDLLNSTGSVLAVTTTNASGNYSFTNLNAGVYEVQFVSPTGDTFTTQNVPTNPAAPIDSVVNSTGLTALITLTSGEVDNNVNAGLVAPLAALGDYVWLDANDNGLQDSNETGVAGVTVDLLAADTLTLKISEDYYLANAQYTVAVNGVQIGGVMTATASHAAGADNIITLNGDFGTNPNVTVTFLNDAYGGTASTDRNLYVDGITYNGVNQNMSAALDSNGSKNFQLTGAGESVLAVTTTNSAGYYAFTGLSAGAYEVKFVAPTGDIFTTENVGTNPAIDSNANQTTGITAPVTLTAGQVNNTIDAGLVQTAALGNYVWLDANDNGLQDSNETGVAGVTVDLLAADTLTLKISEDYYLANAQYTVAVNGVQIGGVMTATASHSAGADNIITLNGDFGTNPNVTVTFLNDAYGGTASTDRNLYVDGITYNGVNQNMSAALDSNGSQSFQLTGAGGSVLAVTTTNSSGYYSFNNLTPGTYEVQFVAPTGDTFTTQYAGTNTAIDSNANAAGLTGPVTLTAGQTDNTIDAGLIVSTASIGDYVWLDLNRNGLQNAGEPGVAGVTVELLNATGTSILATTTTNSSGLYDFNNLNAGVYEVKFVAPTGDTFTTQTVGTNTAIDSNPNQTTGITAPITLAAGQVNNTIDAELVQQSGISVLKQPCSVVVNQCGQITYTFAVTNTGSTALTNVQIVDNIGSATNPDNVTPTAVMSGNYNVGDTNHNGILDPGETWDYTETVSQINCTTANSGSVCHTATGSNLTAGCTAWLHSSFDPTNCSNGTIYKFQGVKCIISGGGVGSTPITVTCPNSEVIFSSTCKSATTVYNASTNCWVTTLPANCNPGSVFLTGIPLTIPSGCNLSNSSVTWSIGNSSNNCGISNVSWDGGCTGYQTFDANGINGCTNYNNIGVKSCDNQSGYGAGGSCNTGYGYNGSSYCDLGYSSNGGGCGGSGSGYYWNSHGWQGCATDDAGTPENQFVNNNCGSTSSCDGYAQACGGWAGWEWGGSGWYYTCGDNTGSSSCGSSSSGGSCGNSGSDTQNCTSIAGAADTVTVTAQAVTGTSCATTTPTGSNLTSGCTAWLNTTFKPTSCANGATYNFTGVTCTINGAGGSPLVVNCPNAQIVFSSSCTAATTVYNASTNTWVTTLPANCAPGNVFLSGCPITIPSGCNLANSQVTWSIGGSTNNCGATNLNWNGNCVGYSSFNVANSNGLTNYNNIGVKSCDTLASCGNTSLSAGAPVQQYTTSNCGNTSSCTTTSSATNNCGTTPTTTTGVTVTATDTKEVQILGCNSNISVGGTATTSSLSAVYGTAQTLEFTYNPGNTVSLKQVQAGLASVTGTNSATMAFMEITNNANPFASNASIYFQGAVTSGEEIFADATTNVLTNTPIANGHFSTTAGSDIYAYVFTSQQAFLSGAAPVQTMAYNTSGSQAMHIGDTIGSLSVIGYVGSTGGHLSS